MAAPTVTKQVWCDRGKHLIREEPFQPLGKTCPDPLVSTISSCDACLSEPTATKPRKKKKSKG